MIRTREFIVCCDVSVVCAVCCTVTLFELTVVNNWWILMVSLRLLNLCNIQYSLYLKGTI